MFHIIQIQATVVSGKRIAIRVAIPDIANDSTMTVQTLEIDSLYTCPWEELLVRWRTAVVEAAERMGREDQRAMMIPQARDTWSIKEILGHLVDSASNNHQRFVRAQLTDDLFFPGYDQDAWVDLQAYKDADWFDLIELWKGLNLHLVRVCSRVTVASRNKLRSRHNLDEIAWRVIPESEPVTLEYFIRDYVGHMVHHLTQMFPR